MSILYKLDAIFNRIITNLDGNAYFIYDYDLNKVFDIKTGIWK